MKAVISDREKVDKEKVQNTPDVSVLNLLVVGDEVEEPQIEMELNLPCPLLTKTNSLK